MVLRVSYYAVFSDEKGMVNTYIHVYGTQYDACNILNIHYTLDE